VAVFVCILLREVTLKGVGHELAAGIQLIAPGIGFSLQPAALRKFKLGARRLIKLSSPLLYAFGTAAELNTAMFDSQNRNLENTLEFPAQELLHPLLA
jgi:hypothetical protein